MNIIKSFAIGIGAVVLLIGTIVCCVILSAVIKAAKGPYEFEGEDEEND